jgi:hypothetical protein
MLEFKEIDHNAAVKWLENPSLKLDNFHKSFDFWIQHIFYARKEFPELKKFLKAEPRWVAAFKNNQIISVYYFSIKDNEMYDGFLISDPEYSNERAGLKLGKFLYDYTKDFWSVNWSIAMEGYVNFNKRLGYQVIRESFIDGKFQTKAFLIKRTHERNT